MLKFYWTVQDKRFDYVVIISKYNGSWVFCKHNDRDTYKCPCGYIVNNESIDCAARRELIEETGALEYKMIPVCAYSVTDGKHEMFGMLYYANIHKFEEKLRHGTGKIVVSDELPIKWTYPKIQPKLLRKAEEIMLSTVM